MAKVFPSLEQFPNLRQKPTDGESHLINFLINNLDDSYEIYFQPFLNGDRPDIILMREYSGVMIIEVKDWHLENYRINQKKQWEVTQNGENWYSIKSPIDQVLVYKQNLYDLHIENLLEKNIKQSHHWAIVTCAVYFHCETEAKINHFLTGHFQQDQSYLNFLSHQIILGNDSLKKENFNKILDKNYLNKKSKYFDEQLYKSFKRHLQPPYHTKEEGKELNYTSKQQELIISKIGQQKAKGVAGSGKTCVLAKRAVNALKRIENEDNIYQPKILILTYNITLINYIHDRISEIKEDFNWSSFHIINYHDFITQELNNLEIKIDIPDDFDDWNSESRSLYFETNYYSNLDLFLNNTRKIKQYSVIFIDEIQDYKKEWVEIIKKCYLEDNGEYVVFGDEKQNVYERKMEVDKKPYTGIGGAWNLLKQSFRLSSNIANLASNFQQEFFTDKYEIEKVEISEHNIFSFSQNIEYISMTSFSSEKITNLIKEKVEKYAIHPNDISIQSSRIGCLRKIDYYFRNTQKLKTTRIFETQEIYQNLAEKNLTRNRFRNTLETIRKNKKRHFWMNTGNTKFSTIHSFKGWEIDTLFLLIEKDSEKNCFITDELIYTAITRCRNNLFIIDLEGNRYKDFFQSFLSSDHIRV
ncbi:DNA helicase II related protein [Geminocystis sp. NIES-3708]|uniref:NERD domain-containing protein n=1 Tax=Geminocystis sp. NIES-3708 TaxID=1615909 RepID=UPI0005FCA41F|nr:NERD domain-containing protein [Geminocystis sp. NIES-3708]BAQ60552.1 DNA helicase II related protein [Geminocystis sp. NIES-3708]